MLVSFTKTPWKFLHTIGAVVICLALCNAFEQNGIPDAPIIPTEDRRYAAFKLVDDSLQEWMDTSIDPCDDFYGYTCKKGQEAGLTGRSKQSDEHNVRLMMEKYKNEQYFQNAPTPVKQLKQYFEKCVNTEATVKEVNAVFKQRIEEIKNESGMGFPMLYQSEKVDAFTPEQISKLIGLEISENGFYSAFFKVAVLPDNVQLDMQKLLRQFSISAAIPQMFFPITWDKNEILEHLKESACTLELQLDEDQLQNDVARMLEFRKTLSEYSSEDNVEQWKLSDLQNSDNSINWIKLIEAALKRSPAVDQISFQTSIVIQGKHILSKILNNDSGKKFAPSTIANYLYFRSTYFTKKYLNLALNNTALTQYFVYKGMFRQDMDTSIKPHSHEYLINLLKEEYSQEERACLHLMSTNIMRDASTRLFADAAFPSAQAKLDMRNNLTKLIEYVRSGFHTQLDMANWMSEETKKKAYEKLANMKFHKGYPEWTDDDTMLSEYYKDKQIKENSSMIEMHLTFKDFENPVLIKKEIEDFFLPPSLTNSLYSVLLNAAFIYAGMYNDVYYNPNYPSPYNFGAFAFIIGHELTHGFDSTGSHFDANGTEREWMDTEARKSFNEMARCVREEYSQFCLHENECLSGKSTLGENIADNGGMQAAYKAYKHFESFNGPEPRLPSKFGRAFNSDQLFFLAFAHSWCAEVPDHINVNDDHSPAMYRVPGALKNFPAFRAAFNCPVNSNYTPAAHCNVWTSEPFK